MISVVSSWTCPRPLTRYPTLPYLTHLLILVLTLMYLTGYIQDYFCQRSQYVVVNGECSTTSNVISGVPQGSVLGPLLFVIYVNGITQLPFQEGSHLLLYADDILLYRSIKTQEDYYILQQHIALLEAWISQRYICS